MMNGKEKLLLLLAETSSGHIQIEPVRLLHYRWNQSATVQGLLVREATLDVRLFVSFDAPLC